MASIPDATSLQSPQLQFNRFTPHIDPRGAAQQAEGIVQAGQALTNLGAELAAQRQKEDNFKALTAYNDWNTQQNMNLEKAKRDAPAGAPDFTPAWHQQAEQSRQEFLNGIPASQRQDFTLRTQQATNQRLQSTQTWQQEQADQKTKDDIDVRMNEQRNRITSDPSSYKGVIDQTHQELDAAPLPRLKIEEMKREFASKAERDAIDARVAKGEDPRDIAREVRIVPETAPMVKAPEETARSVPADSAVIPSASAPGANDNAKSVPQGQEVRAGQAPETKAGETPAAAKPFTYLSKKSGAPKSVSPEERDALVRVVLGEAGGETPEGQAAVAHVVLNRVKQGGFGSNPLAVMTAPNQFEAVDRGALSKNWSQKDINQAGKVVDDVLAGRTPDPTKGATYYYSPSVQAQFGRKPPSWSREFTKTTTIGTHEFFSDPDHPVHENEKKGSMPGGYFQAPGLNIQYRIDPKATYGVAASQKAEPFIGEVIHTTGDDRPAMEQVAYGHGVDAFRGGSFGYHFYIDKDGTIIQGAPLDARTNHIMPMSSPARGEEGGSIPLENKNSIGIAMIGQPGQETPQQVAAVRRLSTALGNTFGYDPHASTFGHGELQPGNPQAGIVGKLPNEGMKGVLGIRDGEQEQKTAEAPYKYLNADDRRVALHNLNIAGRNRTRQEIENAISDIEHFGKPSRDDNGRTALDRAVEEQTLTPNEIAKEKIKWQAAQMKFDAVQPLKNMTPDQWEDWRDNHLMPKEGEDTDVSKSKWAAYKAAEKAWNTISEDRAKDPAMAVNGDPRVKQAYAESSAAEKGAKATLVPSTPVPGTTAVVPLSPQEAHKRLIEARMQAQADVGIDPALRQPITKKEAIKLLGMGTKPSALTDKQFTDGLKAASARAQQIYGPEIGAQVFDSAVHQVIMGKDNVSRAKPYIGKIARGEMLTPDDIADLSRASDPNQVAMARFAAPQAPATWNEPASRATETQMRQFSSAAGQPPGSAPQQNFAPQTAASQAPSEAHLAWLQQQLQDPAVADKAIAAFDSKFGKNAHVAALMKLIGGGVTTSVPPAIPDNRPWYQRTFSSPPPAPAGYQGGATPAAAAPAASTKTPIKNPLL